MPEKPQKGVCSRCKSTELVFQDDGQGICSACGRQFWWDPSRNPNPQAASLDTAGGQTDLAAQQDPQSAEALKAQMEQELEYELPKDDDLAQLERMRRLGRMYKEGRIPKDLYRSKMDLFKAEFHH